VGALVKDFSEALAIGAAAAESASPSSQ
jgi:hypothetical protein